MLKIEPSARFKKDVIKAKKNGYDIDSLNKVINKLAREEKLEEKYRDHPLHGKLIGFRECHIKPDWLLVYRKDNDRLILYL